MGMTYALPGYRWMPKGYLEVALWCALWGYCLGAISSWFVREREGKFGVAFYFAFLPIFIIAFLDGGVVTVLRNGEQLSPVLVWIWVARRGASPIRSIERAAPFAVVGWRGPNSHQIPQSRSRHLAND